MGDSDSPSFGNAVLSTPQAIAFSITFEETVEALSVSMEREQAMEAAGGIFALAFVNRMKRGHR